MGLWIILALGVLAATAGWNPDRRASSPDASALGILDARLARGELSTAEHARRREMLSSGHGRGRRPWRIVTLAVAGVTLVILLMSAVSGWGWAGYGSTGTAWMGNHMGRGGTTATTSVPFADAREIDIEAGDLWFRPERIDVPAGQEVNLSLTNAGRTFHDLTVPAADLVIDAEAGDTSLGGLRLDEPGSYEFYCSVPGHADAGMRGTIVVTG